MAPDVVHQDVDPAESLQGLAHRATSIVAIHGVGDHGHASISTEISHRQQIVELVLRPGRHHHGRSLGGVANGDRSTDPPAGSGDHGDQSIQLSHRDSSASRPGSDPQS